MGREEKMTYDNFIAKLKEEAQRSEYFFNDIKIVVEGDMKLLFAVEDVYYDSTSKQLVISYKKGGCNGW